MVCSNRFVICNELPTPLSLNIEPEGVFFPLNKGEEVSVSDVFTEHPATVKVSLDNGELILSIWPGDGEVRIEKDGADVLDLLQEGLTVQEAGNTRAVG